MYFLRKVSLAFSFKKEYSKWVGFVHHFMVGDRTHIRHFCWSSHLAYHKGVEKEKAEGDTFGFFFYPFYLESRGLDEIRGRDSGRASWTQTIMRAVLTGTARKHFDVFESADECHGQEEAHPSV
jgi:hypothetical protein